MGPPPRARTRKHWEKGFKLCKHTATEWEAQRPEFEKLYFHDKRKLQDIREIMAQNHGFYANKRQFERKIKQWKLSKNLKTKDVIIMIKKQYKRLKNEGKQTEFKIYGPPVTTEKLKRHISGYQPGNSPPAATPDNIEYGTPRGYGPGTFSKHSYGIPRDIEAPTPQNPEIPRPYTYFSHEQIMDLLNHYMQSPQGAQTDPSHIPSTQDTEMVNAESVSPGRGSEFVSPVNPTVEIQDEENQIPISSPPCSKYIDSVLISTTVIVEKGSGIIDRAPGLRKPPNSALNKGLRTPLHLEALTGNSDMARLLEKGADISALDSDSRTPLHLAALAGHSDIARLLLEKSTDTSALDNDSRTPLHLAALAGHSDIARLLLEKGADISALDSDSRTPLHLAALAGRLDMARLLLGKGADISAPDTQSWSPLHLTAITGCSDVARLLLEKGADISALDVCSWNALHLAAYNGYENVARILLENGADVSSLTGNAISTPIVPTPEDERKAVSADASTLSTSSAGSYIEAFNGHSANMAPPIRKQSTDDISTLTPISSTSLHLAAQNGHEAVTRLPLESGADVPTLTAQSSTPLHLAAQNGHEAVARLLIENGADVSTLTAESSTPLHLAAQNGHEAVTRLLLENGADDSACVYFNCGLHEVNTGWARD